MTDEPQHIDLKGAAEQALLNRGNDSHLELDPAVWHPSQLCMLPECPRSALNRKLNLEKETVQQQGIFQSGANHHRWVEDDVSQYVDGPAYYEYPVRMGYDVDGGRAIHTPQEIAGADIRVVGRCDVFDPVNKVVFDVKSTGSIEYRNNIPGTRYHQDFFAEHDRHRDYVDQLQVYMAALGVEQGRIMYTHKLDLVPRYYPTNGVIDYDPDRLVEVMAKAQEITETLRQYTDDAGQVQAEQVMADGHLFDTCGQDKCWGCQYEDLKSFGEGEAQ